jgi:hypothetical protein
MTDTNFWGFNLRARRGVGNVRTMLFTIASLLPVDCTIQDDTIIVPHFEADNDLMKEIIGLYGSQLRDTEPNQADTENCGYWFWRIKDGKYQQTDGDIVPIPAFWNDGTDPVVLQPEPTEAELLNEAVNVMGYMREFMQAALGGTVHEDTMHYYNGLASMVEMKVNGKYGAVQPIALAVIDSARGSNATSFSQEMADELVKERLIWLCPDCRMYHPRPALGWPELIIKMHEIKDRLNSAR